MLAVNQNPQFWFMKCRVLLLLFMAFKRYAA